VEENKPNREAVSASFSCGHTFSLSQEISLGCILLFVQGRLTDSISCPPLSSKASEILKAGDPGPSCVPEQVDAVMEVPLLEVLLSLAVRWPVLVNENQAGDDALRSSRVDVRCCTASLPQTCWFSYPAPYPCAMWCLQGLWLGNPGVAVPLCITNVRFLQQCFLGSHLCFPGSHLFFPDSH